MHEQEKKILVFSMLREELGLDISCVREVLSHQEIHPLVHAPAFIDGVINVRGHIIAVIDLRKKFSITETSDIQRRRIIIVRVRRLVVGLMVDGVSEVINVAPQNIEATPEVVARQSADCYIASIVRMGERVITVLDIEKLLTGEQEADLSKVKK